MARQIPHIVVSGDPCVDWISVPIPPEPLASPGTPAQPPNWRLFPGTRMVAREGGALLLRRFVEEAVRASGKKASVSGIELDQLENLPPSDIIHSMIGVEQFPVTANDKVPKIYRIQNFGGGDGPASSVPAFYRRRAKGGRSAADLIILDDAGNGFRDSIVCWPAAVRDRRGNPLVLLKLSRPLGEGKLWKKLIREHADHIVAVVDVKDLRALGANISYGISWERTAMDAAWHISWNPAFAQLRVCSQLVVRLGCEAVLYGDNRTGNREYRLYYDPLRIEGEARDQTPGNMTGLTSVFCATIAAQLISGGLGALGSGIKEGILRSYTLLSLGYGANPDSVDYPCKEVFASPIGNDSSISEVSVPTPGEATPVSQRLWSIAAEETGINIGKAARDIVLKGSSSELKHAPVGQFGKLKTVDRMEIESYRSIRNLIMEYIDTPVAKRPLSIAVFGQPGSGKSFGVTEVATSLDPDKVTKKGLEFNISQFKDERDLIRAFHRVRDVVLSGKTPLVFFDEFDSASAEGPLGWLKYFLMPMQDGEFRDGESLHPIGKCIFVFAGGTSATFEGFSRSDDPKEDAAVTLKRLKAAKVPDFVSRLRGYVDVAGPNPNSLEDGLFRIRRALLFRSLMQQKAPHLFDRQKRLQIDPQLVDALIGVPAYEHGARSMEAIIDMSLIAGKSFYDQGSLPPAGQLRLHLDADTLFELMHLGAAIEEIAKAIHERYRKKQRKNKPKDDPSMRPWDRMDESLRESNRQQAMHIPTKLKTLGYTFRPKSSASTVTQFSDGEVEALAVMEHKRYVDERLLRGWRPGPERDTSRKISPYLVSWEELKDMDKNPQEWDRDAVRDIPQVLDLAGFEIVPK